MVWRNLLFCHWAMSAEYLRRFVPQELPLETYEGRAYLGVTPFCMDLGLRGLPMLYRNLPELNVRTYVTLDGRPGVFFFSLDIASTLATLGARVGYGLPYFLAMMRAGCEGEHIEVRSSRKANRAEFHARYRPTSPVSPPEQASLEHFLVERYSLYVAEQGKVYRTDIAHVPWALQGAEAEITHNTMAAAAGIELPAEPPLLHFARELFVRVWLPIRVR
jgi:uncharacterized protein YqjF (DUF2071 family)